MRSAHLAIDNLTISYGGAAAVSALSLEARPGELLALLGPSGSGKSTTLRCVAGFLAPDQGNVALDGRSILGLPPERREAALVFQQPTLFPHLSVSENVEYGLLMRCVERPRRHQLADEMLAAVQLAGFGRRRPHQISGGQRQRVALARALVTAPRVLLLDEPFAALDPELRDEMRALVRELQRQQGVTTVLVTHDQQEASVLADQVALLIDGRLRQVGPPEAFYTRPASLAVARFFGAQNFIDGALDADRRTVATALGPLRLSADGPQPGLVTLVIRPEQVRLAEPHAGGLRGQVRERQFLGALHRYTIAVGPVVLTALSASALFRAGDEVAITLPPEHLWAIARDQ